MGELTISTVQLGNQLSEGTRKEPVSDIIQSFAFVLQGLTNVNPEQNSADLIDLPILTESDNLEMLTRISSYVQAEEFNFGGFKEWYSTLPVQDKSTVYKLLTTLQEVPKDKLPLIIKLEEQSPTLTLMKEKEVLEVLVKEMDKEQLNKEVTSILRKENNFSIHHQVMSSFPNKRDGLEDSSLFQKYPIEFLNNEVVIHNTNSNGIFEEVQNEGLIRNFTIPTMKGIKTVSIGNPIQGLDVDTQHFTGDRKVESTELQQISFQQIQTSFKKTEFIPNRPQVTEHLNTNQPFTDDLGKILIKNLQLPNGLSETKIKLHPQELGQVDVKLLAKDGMISAHIVTESSLGKELLQGQIHQLKQALIQQGYNVERIEVSQIPQSTSAFDLKQGFQFAEQQSFKQHSSNGGKSSSYMRGYNDEMEDINNTVYTTSGIDYTV